MPEELDGQLRFVLFFLHESLNELAIDQVVFIGARVGFATEIALAAITVGKDGNKLALYIGASGLEAYVVVFVSFRTIRQLILMRMISFDR